MVYIVTSYSFAADASCKGAHATPRHFVLLLTCLKLPSEAGGRGFKQAGAACVAGTQT
jgi:hypothetical protein